MHRRRGRRSGPWAQAWPHRVPRHPRRRVTDLGLGLAPSTDLTSNARREDVGLGLGSCLAHRPAMHHRGGRRLAWVGPEAHSQDPRHAPRERGLWPGPGLTESQGTHRREDVGLAWPGLTESQGNAIERDVGLGLIWFGSFIPATVERTWPGPGLIHRANSCHRTSRERGLGLGLGLAHTFKHANERGRGPGSGPGPPWPDRSPLPHRRYGT
jgi:hypothetical protein